MISVIIPTYNRVATIERSVRSVLNQTYRDIECIVVDDCSEDNTRKIIDGIADERLRYFCLEKNSGACVARNRGIKEAKGDYIAFQDSDDEWRPQKLELQMYALEKYGADVCFCQKDRIGLDKKTISTTRTELSEGVIPYKLLCESSKVSTQTILAHRDVFEKVLFDENVKKAQDYEWTIRAGEKYVFCFVAEALVIQYFQKDSLTIAGRNHRVEYQMCEYFCEKFKERYECNKDLEMLLLQRKAYYKTLCGEYAGQEYWKVYKIGRKKKDLIRAIMPMILLKAFYESREKKKNRVIYVE